MSDPTGACYDSPDECHYTEDETQALLNFAYQQATAGPIEGLVNIYKNSSGGGHFDFGAEGGFVNTENDTWLVGEIEMGPREMGNFMAGFQAGAYDEKHWGILGPAEAAVSGAGIYYARRDPDEDDYDRESRPWIRFGVETGRRFLPSDDPTDGLRLPRSFEETAPTLRPPDSTLEENF
jgi:hypothetical protein